MLGGDRTCLVFQKEKEVEVVVSYKEEKEEEEEETKEKKDRSILSYYDYYTILYYTTLYYTTIQRNIHTAAAAAPLYLVLTNRLTNKIDETYYRCPCNL